MATHWKTLANQDYIGAYALQPGEDLTVTIRAVVQQQVTGSGGRKQECIVAVLEAPHKPLILNSTNSKSIQKLYGPYIEDWAGKQITLYASTTQLAGDVVECIRIRPTVGAPKKSAITDDRLEKAIESIKAGNYSKEQLLKSFELTIEQAATLAEKLETVNA